MADPGLKPNRIWRKYGQATMCECRPKCLHWIAGQTSDLALANHPLAVVLMEDEHASDRRGIAWREHKRFNWIAIRAE